MIALVVEKGEIHTSGEKLNQICHNQNHTWLVWIFSFSYPVMPRMIVSHEALN
jgi:hypothetical protein